MGAKKINQMLRASLERILLDFQVIHICGQGHVEEKLQGQAGYCQFEFVGEDLGHLFAITDIVLSRSGANALYEILTLAKPHVLIPLSKQASRGDQIDNAMHFVKIGISTVILEENLDQDSLLNAIAQVYTNKESLKEKMQKLGFCSATEKVKAVLMSTLAD